MKSHRSDNSGARESTEPLNELIPWFVNGTLSEAEAEAVRARCEADPEFAAEVEAQRSLAALVEQTPVSEEAIARSWDALQARIVADGAALQAPVKPRRMWSGMRLALAGCAAAACLVVAIQIGQPTGGEFETLTSDTANAELLLRFQVQPGFSLTEIEEVLGTQGVTLVGGPSETGVYVGAVAEDADPKAAAEALMAQDEILFAAPEVIQ